MTPSLPDDVQHLSWAADNWGSAPRLRIGWWLSARYPGRLGSELSGVYGSAFLAEVHGEVADRDSR